MPGEDAAERISHHLLVVDSQDPRGRLLLLRGPRRLGALGGRRRGGEEHAEFAPAARAAADDTFARARGRARAGGAGGAGRAGGGGGAAATGARGAPPGGLGSEEGIKQVPQHFG